MKISLPIQYSNKTRIIFLFLLLILIIQCKRKEITTNTSKTKKIQYVGFHTGRRLGKENQQKVFGKWKFSHIHFMNDTKNTEKRISINENIVINELGIFNAKGQSIAWTHMTIGTYKFITLDSLNTSYYVRTFNDKKMVMQNSLLRAVNHKITKERASAYLVFIRE